MLKKRLSSDEQTMKASEVTDIEFTNHSYSINHLVITGLSGLEVGRTALAVSLGLQGREGMGHGPQTHNRLL
jgi:hypothetical protein